MDSNSHARQLRRSQTPEERQLWQALRAGRFAGFKFRRQHAVGKYILDFYCTLGRIAIELDGFQHGLSEQNFHDQERGRWLHQQGIKVLRFWNGQWRRNRAGLLLEIWAALHDETGCVSVERMPENRRFIPPPPGKFKNAPLPNPPPIRAE